MAGNRTGRRLSCCRSHRRNREPETRHLIGEVSVPVSVGEERRLEVEGAKGGTGKGMYRRVGVGAYRRLSADCRGCEPGGRTPGALS
jgi:hypothetical protein